MAKGDKPKPPVKIEPNYIGVSVRYDQVMMPDAVGVITPDTYTSILGNNDGGRIMFTIPSQIPYPDWGYTISITCEGYNDVNFRVDPKTDGNSFDVDLTKKNVLPPVPTRDQVCGINITFSGLTVETSQLGSLPWFETAYQCLTSSDDRQSVRQQKRAAGDTHLILEFFTNQQSIYADPSQPYYNVISPSGEQNQDWFRGLVLEVIQDNLIPIVVFDGDNGDNPQDGYPNALRQLPIIANLLGDLAEYILFGRLWDGVFYGSTPENIRNFGIQFRSLIPGGYLAIEHNPGHIPVGNGPSDWSPNGMMDAYDVLMSEVFWPAPIANPPAITGATYDTRHGYVPVWASDISNWMNSWQIVARCINNYNPPANQPFNVVTTAIDGPQKGQQIEVSSDSRPASFYLVPSSRGPRYYCMFEVGEYEWVRNQVSVSDLKAAGNYYRQMGCRYVGLPR